MTAEELMATIAALSSIGLVLFTFYIINLYIYKPKKTMLVNTKEEFDNIVNMGEDRYSEVIENLKETKEKLTKLSWESTLTLQGYLRIQ